MPVSESLSGRFVAIYSRNDYSLEEKLKLLASPEVERYDAEAIDENLLKKLKKSFPENLTKKVRLIFPFKREEKRQKSVALTNAQLFLGSMLFRNGFQVKCENHLLGSEYDHQTTEPGFTGITVFEENVPELVAFIKENFGNSSELLMLGGPFITLAGEAAAVYFPRANLLVRGEAEFVLPRILQAICQVEPNDLFSCDGFIFHWQNLLVVSDFDRENYPVELSGLFLCAELFAGRDLSTGLELNLLRGCQRSCIFCSRLQKRKLRYYPPEQLKEFLVAYRGLVKESKENSPFALSININDDDILQDKEYFFRITRTIKSEGFSLWGLQTSLQALFVDFDRPDEDFFERFEADLFVEHRPLFWIGTDIFAASRAKRMAKFLPSQSGWLNLLEILQQKEIENYHYWILSDFLSDWDEFIAELRQIEIFVRKFSRFHVMPIAPFLIPYAHTPAFRFIQIMKATERIVYRPGSRSEIYPLVMRVETAWPVLNDLLRTGAANSEEVDFFNALKRADFFQVWKIIYAHLRQERLQSVDQKAISALRQVEEKVEQFLKEGICAS